MRSGAGTPLAQNPRAAAPTHLPPGVLMRLISSRARRRASLLAACLPFVFALACGDSGTNPNNEPIDGTYSLKTLDGSPLPITFQSGTSSITLTNDVLTVASNGSWRSPSPWPAGPSC